MPLKRTGSSTSAVHQARGNGKTDTNAAKANNANFALTKAADGDDDDDDQWVSSSGAQTPNHDDDDSDTASEGSGLPQELVQQLERTQLEQQPVQELTAAQVQTPLSRVETARQSDFQATTQDTAASVTPSYVNDTPNSVPSIPTQTPSPTDDSEPHMDSVIWSSHDSQLQPFAADCIPAPSITGGQQRHVKKANHSHSESYPNHVKRESITRPPSAHSMAGRHDSAPVRPHPLIRGHSHGYLNLVPKPTPLAPLTIIADQPTSAPNGQLSGSPASVKSTGASPEAHTAFPLQRRTSVSSARSVATLPAHSSVVQPSHKPYDRARTFSMTTTSSALKSLVHLPSVTRPPSPQLISFFPPVNPHINIEAIHPLLPGPYLHNHLTVLARRAPLRESYNRVIQAKMAGSR